MRNYLYFYTVSLEEFVAYRASLFFEFFGLLIKSMLIFSFWTFFIENSEQVGFSTNINFLTYVIVAAILPSVISSDAGIQLGKKILSGDIATDLIKPYNVVLMLATKSLFFSLFKVILFLVPILALFKVFNLIDFSISSIPFFAVSLFFATITMLIIYLLIGLISFWTENWWGIKLLFDGIITFLSGAIIPLSLFPAYFQSINSFLPFQYTVYVPANVLVFGLNESFTQSIFIQLLWIICLLLVFNLIWKFALKKLVIFGG